MAETEMGGLDGKPFPSAVCAMSTFRDGLVKKFR